MNLTLLDPTLRRLHALDDLLERAEKVTGNIKRTVAQHFHEEDEEALQSALRSLYDAREAAQLVGQHLEVGHDTDTIEATPEVRQFRKKLGANGLETVMTTVWSSSASM